MLNHNSMETVHSNIKEKILLISSRPFELSGMAKIEIDIINGMSKDIDFDVASFDYCYEYDEFLKEKGISRYKLADKKHMLSYISEIYKIVKNGIYRKVYIHGNSSLMLIEALPSKLAGAKVITHCHNGKPQNKLFKYFICKPFLNCVTDSRIACSKEAAEWAYSGEYTVIKNGIDINRFKYNKNARNAVRQELGLNESCVVGHIGNFNKQKNHQKLISVFEEIVKIIPNSKLLLIGEGELKKEIEESVKKKQLLDKVIFMGYVNDPENYIQAMDVMIIPSIFEGFCLAALEAQVSGLPVVTSDRIPDEALVIDNCEKMQLEDKNKKWAEKVVSMLNKERKDNSKLLFERGYSIEHMIKRIKNILLK